MESKETEQAYERPILVKEKGMTFPLRIIVADKEVICKQCSACHGCR